MFSSKKKTKIVLKISDCELKQFNSQDKQHRILNYLNLTKLKSLINKPHQL